MADSAWSGRRVWLAAEWPGFAMRRRAMLRARLDALGAQTCIAAEDAQVVVAGDVAALAAAPRGAFRILDVSSAPPERAAAADLVWTWSEFDEPALRARLRLPVVAVPHVETAARRRPLAPDRALGLRLRLLAPEQEAGWFLHVARPIWRAGLAPLTVLRPEGDTASPFTAAIGEADADLVLLPAGGGAEAAAEALASGLPLIAGAEALGLVRTHHPLQAAPDAAAMARGALMAAYDPALLVTLARAAAATHRAVTLAVALGLERSAALLPSRTTGASVHGVANSPIGSGRLQARTVAIDRSLTLDRATLPSSPDEAELDEIMGRIRAELGHRREATAAGALAAKALPTRYDEFAALPEDAFVEAAHRVVLGRSPTPEEREKAAWLVRGRMSRAVMLERMLTLPEAKARGASVPGVTRQAFLDRVARVIRESPVTSRLRPMLRVGRGAKRLARAAPRLARIEEALAATRQAAVGEQTRRFTSFALQQTELVRGLEARIGALEGGAPSPTLARALEETAAERAMPAVGALALLRAAPGPVLAPGASEEVVTALAAAGLTIAEGEALSGAVLVSAEATLAALDALMAEAPARLAPGGFLLLPPAAAPAAALGVTTPAAAAPDSLLRCLSTAHGLEYEERDGVRLAWWRV